MHPLKLSGVLVLFAISVGVRSQSGEDYDQNYDLIFNEDIRHDEHLFELYKRRLNRLRDHLLRFPASPGYLLEKTTVKPIDDTPPGVPEIKKKCPPGFHYVPKARNCYNIVYERHNWTSADRRCHELHPGAHLIAITDNDENIGVEEYLREELRKYGRKGHTCIPLSLSWGNEQFWTSGRRPNEKSCVEPFVWKISNDTQLPMSFTNWFPHEPNCSGDNEHCLHLPFGGGLVWNDINCSEKICPLCEYDPSE